MSANATAALPPRASLLGLPRELRDEIYALALPSSAALSISITGDLPKPALLGVNRPIRHEASMIHRETYYTDHRFYSHNNFVACIDIHNLEGPMRWASKVSPLKLTSIRNFNLAYDAGIQDCCDHTAVRLSNNEPLKFSKSFGMRRIADRCLAAAVELESVGLHVESIFLTFCWTRDFVEPTQRYTRRYSCTMELQRIQWRLGMEHFIIYHCKNSRPTSSIVVHQQTEPIPVQKVAEVMKLV